MWVPVSRSKPRTSLVLNSRAMALTPSPRVFSACTSALAQLCVARTKRLPPGAPRAHKCARVMERRATVLIVGALLVGSIVALLLFRERSHSFPPPPKHSTIPKTPAALYSAVRAYLKERISVPVTNWRVDVTGTPGTPIVVGYETDRSRTGIFRGVVPTNFTVRARRCVYCAVKNVGSTAAKGRVFALPPTTRQTRVPPSGCCAALRSTLPGDRPLLWSRIVHVA